MSHSIRRTAVVGAGAVGSFFGAMLGLAGHPVSLIGRAAHVAAVQRDGLQLRRAGRVESVRLAASTRSARSRSLAAIAASAMPNASAVDLGNTCTAW